MDLDEILTAFKNGAVAAEEVKKNSIFNEVKEEKS